MFVPKCLSFLFWLRLCEFRFLFLGFNNGRNRFFIKLNPHILIDTHDTPVSEPVWELFTLAVRRLGVRPTLIEWDSDYPPLEVLISEADKAQSILDEANELAA